MPITDIKTGTIGLVSVIRSERMWLCKGIQLSQGSMWNHAFIVVEIAGVLYAVEEGTIWGITFTLLSAYFDAERNGDCVLCFKNLKDVDVDKFQNAIIHRALAYVGRRPYGVFEIPYQFVKQNLQKVGVNIDRKSKRMICSYLVRNILNHVTGAFGNDTTPSPDDLHKDMIFTHFIYI